MLSEASPLYKVSDITPFITLNSENDSASSIELHAYLSLTACLLPDLYHVYINLQSMRLMTNLLMCSQYFRLLLYLGLRRMKRKYPACIYMYTEDAGPEISMNLCIASLFSRQIANSNAGPTLALESMGAKLTFRCHFLNIGPSYKQ